MAATAKLEDCDYLRLLLPDICGTARSKTFTSVAFDDFVKFGHRTFAGAIGLSCDGTPNMRMLEDQNGGNGWVKPDWSTLHSTDTAGTSKYKYKEVICSMHDKQSGRPLMADPRHAAQRMLDELRKLGLTAYSTYEVEFRLMLPDGRAVWQPAQFASAEYLSGVAPFLEELHACCRTAGVQLEALHTETGSGQLEVNILPQAGIAGPDHGFLFKLVAKEVARRHGYVASFVTKPLPAQTGNGWHLNLSLWSEDGRNAFYADGERPTEIGRQFAAGLSLHAAGIAALCSPTVNCYRRLHTPWAPHVSDVSVDGRMSTFRLQCHEPRTSRVENRIVSSACSPYLAFAATLAAGVDGIRRRLQLSDDTQRRELPHSLPEALEAMKADSAIRELLGEDLLLWFDVAKTDRELQMLADVNVKEERPRDFERERELYVDL